MLSVVASIACGCTLSVVVGLVLPPSSILVGVMIGSASALILDVRGVGGLAGTPSLAVTRRSGVDVLFRVSLRSARKSLGVVSLACFVQLSRFAFVCSVWRSCRLGSGASALYWRDGTVALLLVMQSGKHLGFGALSDFLSCWVPGSEVAIVIFYSLYFGTVALLLVMQSGKHLGFGALSDFLSCWVPGSEVAIVIFYSLYFGTGLFTFH